MKRHALVILLAILLISACGQKGPLYRPGKQTPPAPSSSLALPR